MKWLRGSIVVLTLVGCSTSPGISSNPTGTSTPPTNSAPATNETSSATSNPLCGDESSADGSKSPVASAGFVGAAGEERVMMTAPPTTNPEPESEASDVALYATFIEHDPCATGTQRTRILVRYVVQGDVIVGDELDVVIDDNTFRDGEIAVENTGPTDVFLFSLERPVGGATRVKAVGPADGGLSLHRLEIGVDRPRCSVGPPDRQARIDARVSDRQPTIEPGTVVVAADVLLDFGADDNPGPIPCANGAVPSQSAVIVVRDSYKGNITPGTMLTVTTFDTSVLLSDRMGPSDNGVTDVVVALTPDAELPGIGRADWAAVGPYAVDSGFRDRQDAWKSAIAAAPSETEASGSAGTTDSTKPAGEANDAGADTGSNSGSADGSTATCDRRTGDARTHAPVRELPTTGDIVALASITTPVPCTAENWTATVKVEWVGHGDVEVGDELDVVIGSDTFSDVDLQTARGDGGVAFVFLIDRVGGDLVASTAIAPEKNDFQYWRPGVDRPGCSDDPHPSIESVATNPPSTNSAGAADAVIVGRVLDQLGPIYLDPSEARCSNGAVESHSAVVEVRESVKGDLAPGTVLLVTAYNTAGWFETRFSEDDPDPIIALTKDVQLPGVGTAEWAASGFDRIDDGTAERIAAWTEAIATAGTQP